MGGVPEANAMSAVSTARRRSELNTVAIPSSPRRSPSSRAWRRPCSDSRLWLHPEATPSSLSSLMACVSKTTVIDTRPTLRAVCDPAAVRSAGSCGSDGAAPHRLDLHHVAGGRSGDHLATTDVEADVLAAARAPEDEVAGLHGVERYVREHRVLGARVVRHAHARRAPGPHGEAGAVEAAGPGAGVAIRLAELRARIRDRSGRAAAVDRDVGAGGGGRSAAAAAGTTVAAGARSTLR